MSPIDSDMIKKKLLLLEKNISILKGYKEVSKNDFLVDFTVNGATLYYMVESIEIIIDIGNHILSENFSITPENYADVIKQLGDNNVIPKDFAEANIEMAKFRNKIIHIYDQINMTEVYEHLQKAPDIFKAFLEFYLKFLKI